MGDANRVFKTALFVCRDKIFQSRSFFLYEDILLYFRYIIVCHHLSKQKPHNSSFLNSQLDLCSSATVKFRCSFSWFYGSSFAITFVVYSSEGPFPI